MTAGKQLKEQGQQLALWNAGKDWTDQMIANLQAFCKNRKDAGRPEFRFEEFRDAAVKAGWPMPSSHKAWGVLPKLAVKQKLIRSTDRYEPAHSRATHAHPVRVWVAA